MSLPDNKGHFGEFGGKYVPETLMALLEDLEKIFNSLRSDSEFKREFHFYLKEYAGRPTNLYHAERLSAHLKTLKVYLKREDSLHT
ncbi:MAG: tryptophan synthase subunit beta, partial [Candidatus Omnitrophica bacterium]|nr:tryptophan synthase subunit beta [Candidatus Omnitrophota bacterium]